MNFKKATLYLHHIIKNKLGLSNRVKPKILSYLITDYCNSHCITCSIWKNKEIHEISLDKLEEVMKKTLFQNIQHVGISGGEPSTCQNLFEHIKVLVNTLHSLETLSITSNCINSQFWVDNLKTINDLCYKRHIYFQFNISLDGIDNMHDRIRGTKNNFYNTNKVINFVIAQKIPYQLHATIDKYNVYHINRILNFAQKLNADIIFRLASEIHRLENKAQLEEVALDDKQKSFLCDFLQSESLLNYTKSPGRKLFYRHLVRQVLGDGSRTAPCYFKHEGVVLASDGTLSFCSRFKKDFGTIYNNNELLSVYQNDSLFTQCADVSCEHCYHDQTGLWSINDVLSLYFRKPLISIKKMFSLLNNYTQAVITPVRHTKYAAKSITNLGLIGMFGGEHVGDAAILGGVVMRYLYSYPEIKTIYIYSFRKDRTLCWVNNLTKINPDIHFHVIDDVKQFKQILCSCELLVWSGGPLMELPVVLSRNYLFVKLAKSYGCRFEIEGVGYGPVNTIFGKKIISKILSQASRITVRSRLDEVKIDNLGYIVDKKQEQLDPAFDYLKLFFQKEILLDVKDKNSIDKLLYKEDGQKIIALNLRPLWSRYGHNNSFDFKSFLDEIVKLVNKLSEKNIITVFFPMNADQYGFSDLNIAYIIKNSVQANSLFRIWETEPSIETLVYFLRKVDYSICMRYHAVIFSLSQNIKTYGLDYSLSGKGKIADLFKDHNEMYISILNFRADKFLEDLNFDK